MKQSDLMAAVRALENKSPHNPKGVWTKEQKEALLWAWPIKRQADVAKLLKHGEDKCREKYKELTGF